MNLSRLSLFLMLLCSLITLTAGSNNPIHFTGDVSINCGSTGTSAARNGREWLGDAQPKLSSFLQLQGLSAASRVIHKLTSADLVPHKTARVSRSQFSYAFQVIPGQKIIRLHFNPTQYKGFKGLKDLFAVEAGPFTLLSNFSASLTAHALGVNTFAKEFCLNIQENQQFNIVFSPENSQSIDTYAFINGIEIISVPAGLSYFYGGDIGIHVVGQKSIVYVDNSTALEIIHRLDIRKDFISSADDSSDIFGMWATLPKEVNNINNITWKISVDVGFRYLTRLHFSKIGFKMAEIRGLSFKVLINEMVAITNTDIVVKERDDSSLPWYGDYMVVMNGHKQEGKRNLLICLQSNEEFMDGHGPLKGFEILKLSNPDSSLASPNPLPPAQDSPSQTIQTLLLILGRRNATATIAITIISLVSIIVYKLREIWETCSIEEEHKPSARAERICRRFSLAEIKVATRNFTDGLQIGRGGFGKVYKGCIDKGKKTVAVKRLKLYSQQGAREFLTEIETLSNLQHKNLVSLIGYCSEQGEMILVYEYMPNGTLADQIYKLGRDGNNSSSLTWKERLNICIGAARGIDYLHTGHGVIHRDIKASNILLDEKKVAKVSDFGLAKLEEDGSRLQSHVSTKVKGTRGYLDAHYLNTCKLTRKTDIFAFGVVLLEVLCGRPAIDLGVSEDERLLSRWARDKISKGEVDQIVASSLRDEISPNSLMTFVGVAERCLHDEPKNRPTMSQVVLQLEYALEEQDNKESFALNASDEIKQSVSTGQPTMGSTDLQSLTNPRKDKSNSKLQVKSKLPSGKTVGIKAAKQSRHWLWEVFWKRADPSEENELLLSAESLRYAFSTIRAATNDFSDDNKLGHGGFGPVYKGKLPNGQEIAVKRFSQCSPLRDLEFKNEVLFLAKLQHRNLVRLFGFALEGREKLLVYEFIQNASLDLFIFDPINHSYLDWDRRYNIIVGIARGILYLHEDSRLRIIHRDLKARSIFLDKEMNPKIADFGLARLLGQDETQGNTSRIVGTYGYMAPEYVMHGQFSIKSDVFSFGMLVLEIISGRKNHSFWNREEVEDLLSFAWKNWRDGTAGNVVDPFLRFGSESGSSVSDRVMLRCIHIGLLCVQENAADRPTMASVVLMLNSFPMALAIPSKPAWLSNGYDSSRLQEYNSRDPEYNNLSRSLNDASITEMYPR